MLKVTQQNMVIGGITAQCSTYTNTNTPDSPLTYESLEAAFQALKAEMIRSPDYAWSWHCNLAMPIYDSGVDHETANAAAARIMSSLFGVFGYQPRQDGDPCSGS